MNFKCEIDFSNNKNHQLYINKNLICYFLYKNAHIITEYQKKR